MPHLQSLHFKIQLLYTHKIQYHYGQNQDSSVLRCKESGSINFKCSTFIFEGYEVLGVSVCSYRHKSLQPLPLF